MTDTSSSPKPATYSIASIISIVAAIASFTSGAILGFILALIAIFFGLVGVIMALSPSRRGGIFSFLALIGGAFGIVAAVIKAVMWLF